MLTNRREKLLAGILGFSLVGVLLWNAFGESLLSPVSRLQADLRQKKIQHHQALKQMSVIDRATAEIDGFYSRSLPADPSAACVTYQTWLLQRLRDCGIKSAIVTPGAAAAVEGVGHRIPFSVSATTELPRIGAFLDMIEASSILHRVTHLNVTATGSSAAKARTLTLGLEAIAINDARDVRTLHIPTVRQSESTLLSVFSDRDLFQRYVPVPRRPAASTSDTAIKQKRPVRQPESVRFVGSVVMDEIRQAWFVNVRSRIDSVLGADQTLKVGSSSMTVLEVTDDAVRLNVDGVERRISLGEQVREVMQVALD